MHFLRGSVVKLYDLSEPISSPLKYAENATPVSEGFGGKDYIKQLRCPFNI